MNIAICLFFAVFALGYSFEAFVSRRRHSLMMVDLVQLAGVHMQTMNQAAEEKDEVTRAGLLNYAKVIPRYELISLAAAEATRASVSGVCALFCAAGAVLSYYLIP